MNQRLAANLAKINEQISAAAARSGRTRKDIRLVAVSKYGDIDLVRALIQIGCCDLGESRPQSLWDKAGALTEQDVRWHMIGHLQRNKVERTIRYTTLIHSVDSLRLLAAINESAQKQRLQSVDVLLEINVSGDESKHGFSPKEMPSVLQTLANYPHVDVIGLMTMAALDGDDEIARQNFADLRELRDSLLIGCPPNVALDELSMGMSRDFALAIEEGATIVRVGSLLLEGCM